MIISLLLRLMYAKRHRNLNSSTSSREADWPYLLNMLDVFREDPGRSVRLHTISALVPRDRS